MFFPFVAMYHAAIISDINFFLPLLRVFPKKNSRGGIVNFIR